MAETRATPESDGLAASFSFEALASQMAQAAKGAYSGPHHLPENRPAANSSISQEEAGSAVSLTKGAIRYTLRPTRSTTGGSALRLFSIVNGRAEPLKLDVSAQQPTADRQDNLVSSFSLSKMTRTISELAWVAPAKFRAIGSGQVNGTSVYPVVVATPDGTFDEIPEFSDFYFEQSSNSGTLTSYASLDGPSMTGAFRFTFSPASAGGDQNVRVDVDARLYFRRDVSQLGVAPLSSMFLYADANRGLFDDYRPQVHDSEGLWVKSADGQQSWRALTNPSQVANSYLGQPSPSAFGLVQRTRSFDSYQDDGARYDLRPSVFVEPLNDWGDGFIRLIERPSRTEFLDNITAFWMPKENFAAGQSVEFRYRLRWGDLPIEPSSPALVRATRAGRGGFSGTERADNLRKFVVDFEGENLDPARLPIGAIDPLVIVSGGRLVGTTLSHLARPDRMRLVIEFEVQSSDPVELRAYLVGGGRQLTETWLYQLRQD